MNFIEVFKQGQSDSIKGIPFGYAMEKITADTNGIQSGRIYGVAGPEKSGKSTFADYVFVLQAYLYAIEHNVKINWVYFSFEIDRISKEFDFMAFFLNHDFGIEKVPLPEGVTKKGLNEIELSPDYLRGYVLDDNNVPIKINPALMPRIQETYNTRIVPLFGEYASDGSLIKRGLIRFIEKKDNPTGLWKDLLALAETEGNFKTDSRGRKLSYKPYQEGVLKIVVIDHIRKLIPERGWQMKQTIDKMSEYLVDLRNLLKYTFVPIIHTNRNLSSVDKMKFFKGDLYPTSDDLKDSGNLGEDCNFLFTIFNPNDDRYSLTEHFGLKIRDTKGNKTYPNLRTIHLVSSRHCEFPRHYKVNMIGNLKKYEILT